MSKDRRKRDRRGQEAPPSAPLRPVPQQQSTLPPFNGAPAVRLQQPGPAQKGAAPDIAARRAAQRAAAQRAAAQRADAQRAARQRAAGQRVARQRVSAQRPERNRVSGALARSRAWARPAGVGARLGAYSIDAAISLLLAGAAWWLTSSLLVGVIVLVESAVIMLVIEARTGATAGNVLLRQRTARDDAPYSPGIGRSLVRGLVQGAGSLFALIGGWIVVATSAADPERMGRSLADRAGRTLVVKVPTAAEREVWTQNAHAWALRAPGAAETASAPLVQPVAARRSPLPVEQNDRVAAPPLAAAAPPLAAAVPSQAEPLMPSGVVPVEAPVAAAPAPREVGALLLVSFDTGQRVQLRIPTVAHLGRRPEASDPDDQIVIVDDPANSVSKTHLRLEYRGDSVWVTDLGSTNGSEMVDDTGEVSALVSGARMRLDDGASVRIGQRSFTVATITGELS